MTLQSISELNRDFMTESRRRAAPPSSGVRKSRSKREKFGILADISDILFYFAVFMIMLSVFTSGSENGAPKKVFGYTYFTVLSGSMQKEIPKGSFILVKETDPQDLKVGDNITFMRDRNTSVTHKIMDIFEDHQHSGARGFETMGVNNAAPDEDIVYEANVVGKVVLVLPAVGSLMARLSENILAIFIIFGLCVAFSFCIRGVFMKTRGKAGKEATENEQ